ncbi:MAG: hypothetical protein ACXVHN_07100 [Methanobacterium sp.]
MLSLEYHKTKPDIYYATVLNGRKESMQSIIERLLVEQDHDQKGKLYEALVWDVFESFFLKEYRRGSANRYSTDQIDIYFQVKWLEATIFHKFSDIMIVECKNWEKSN